MGSALATQMKVNNRMMLNLLRGFRPEQLLHKLEGMGSCPLWNAGHVAVYRPAYGQLLGRPIEEPSWAEHFGRGSDAGPCADWPDRESVVAYLMESEGVAIKLLQAADEDDLNRESIYHWTGKPETVMHNLLTLLFHEAYHIGQVGMVYKCSDLGSVEDLVEL